MRWKQEGQKGAFRYTPDNEGKGILYKIDDVTTDEINKNVLEFTANDNVLQKKIPDNTLVGTSLEESLPSGAYQLHTSFRGSSLHPVVPHENVKLFELDVIDKVLKDFNTFKKNRGSYEKLEMLYKRGILLYGPPGTGKTSCINLIVDSLKSKDILVIYMRESLPRDIKPLLLADKRTKIFILEELVHIVSEDLDELLQFLDGVDSINNSYTIATTNYPEHLPSNLVDRPGRFDVLFEIGYPNIKDRKKYLEYFLDRKVTKKELEATKDLSLAYLKEIVILSIIEKMTIDEVIMSIENRKALINNKFSPPIQTQVGF